MANKCTNKRCSQRPLLYQTGWGASQGCTHRCKICGWGYWTHEIKPKLADIQAAEKANPKFTRDAIIVAMTREVLRPQPPGEWGKGAEKRMIEQLGGPKSPYWLSKKLKRYWEAKYLELYPPPEIKK
jgi:hypothetical protein